MEVRKDLGAHGTACVNIIMGGNTEAKCKLSEMEKDYRRLQQKLYFNLNYP
jgi:hypothetical protein